METLSEIALNHKKRKTREFLISRGYLKRSNNNEIKESGWWYEFGNMMAEEFEAWANDQQGQGIDPLFKSFYYSLPFHRRIYIVSAKLNADKESKKYETLKRTVGNNCYHYPESFETAFIKWKSLQPVLQKAAIAPSTGPTFEDFYLQLRPKNQAMITVTKIN